MTVIHDWAAQWGVPYAAIVDLQARLGAGTEPGTMEGMSEAGVQSRERLAASQRGIYLWRNNVGACYDDNGNFIRYGLANDSKKVNEVIKSGDLIGIKPLFITEAHLGTSVGQFYSREVKEGGWHYTGTPREIAQLAWAQLITSLGGDAAFTNGSDL